MGAALAVVVIVAGCGSSPAPKAATPLSGSPRYVLTAYTTTVGARTAKVAISETVSATPTGKSTEKVKLVDTGIVDFTSQDSTLALSGPDGTTKERFINPVLYIEFPAGVQTTLPAGKTWAEINLNTVTEAKLGASYAQLTSSSEQSTQTLAYLEAVSTSGITTVGTATIRGAATTEYKATIDLAKADDQKIPQVRTALLALDAQLHASTMPIQVWLDAQGRVRQLAFQLKESTVARPSSTPGTTIPAQSGYVTSTVDYYDFGAPLKLAAPSASQTDNLTSQAVADATSTTTTAGSAG